MLSARSSVVSDSNVISFPGGKSTEYIPVRDRIAFNIAGVVSAAVNISLDQAEPVHVTLPLAPFMH